MFVTANLLIGPAWQDPSTSSTFGDGNSLVPVSGLNQLIIHGKAFGHMTVDFSIRGKTMQGMAFLALMLVFRAFLPAEPNVSVRSLGIEARRNAAVRDTNIRQIAEILSALSEEEARTRQNEFQEALLEVCGPSVFSTLSRETIEAVDDACEKFLGTETATGFTGWDRLAYAYGFFNHDTSVEEIERIARHWQSLTPEERRPLYPNSVHVIDAVTRPLSTTGLSTPEETARALAVALPLMVEMLTRSPSPGTAFHEPSHVALVLGPIHRRWSDDAFCGPVVLKHLGTREDLAAMMASRLSGSIPRESLDATALGFYGYTGRYLCHALARLNAREHVPAIRRTLEIHGEDSRLGPYAIRALLTLGDENERLKIESADSLSADGARMLEWIARNAESEARAWAESRLSFSGSAGESE